MREIRYKVFDTDEGRICRNRHGDIAIFTVGDGTEIFTTDLVMMSTDLKDKDGVDIYEDDIVEAEDGEKIRVSYGIQGIDAFEGVGYNLWSHYGEKQDGTRLQSSIKVIGNIHENPDLL
jgi:uncharacterized phage protein (TIGR01671 family)